MQHNLRLRSVLPTFVPAGFVDVGHSTVRDAQSGKTGAPGGGHGAIVGAALVGVMD
jgi:hypothetical protein